MEKNAMGQPETITVYHVEERADGTAVLVGRPWVPEPCLPYPGPEQTDPDVVVAGWRAYHDLEARRLERVARETVRKARRHLGWVVGGVVGVNETDKVGRD